MNFLFKNDKKSDNLKPLFSLIYEQGPLSKKDILQRLDLKLTTLNRMIDNLKSEAFITEFNSGESSGGRPPSLFRVNPKAGYIVGISLTRTESYVVLFNLALEQLDSLSFVMDSSQTPEKVIAFICSTIDSFLETHSISQKQLLGIGIASFGPLDREKGMILNPIPSPTPHWLNVPIVSMISERFPVEIMLSNGANTAAWAEYEKLEPKPLNMIQCISGVGVRCGVITNGIMTKMNEGDAVAFGHMTLNPEGPLCYCGKRGCLEMYTSTNKLKERLQEKRKQQTDTVLNTILEESNEEELQLKHIYEALKKRDKLTLKEVDSTAYYLGIGLANIITILNLDVVVVDGPLFNHYPTYFDKVVNYTEQHLYYSHRGKTDFREGSLGKESSSLGAAQMLFNSFFESE